MAKLREELQGERNWEELQAASYKLQGGRYKELGKGRAASYKLQGIGNCEFEQ